MSENLAWIILVPIIAAAGIGLFVRSHLIRRTYRNGIAWRVYCGRPKHFCLMLLEEMETPEWSAGYETLEGRLRGKGWKLEYQSSGSKRLFYLSSCWDILEEALARWREQGSFFFCLHAVCQICLFASMALKSLLIPGPQDLRMMIGFDSIAAERIDRRRQEHERLLTQESGTKRVAAP